MQGKIKIYYKIAIKNLKKRKDGKSKKHVHTFPFKRRFMTGIYSLIKCLEILLPPFIMFNA